MGENIEVKDVQKTEYLDKNGLDMLWAKVKENIHNQVEVERNRAVAKENSIVDTKADKSEFSNYVPSATFTALEKKVSANTAAISNKQNAGNYLHYETLNDEGYYEIPSVCISDNDYNLHHTILDPESLQIVTGDLEANDTTGIVIASNDRDPYIALTDSAYKNILKITREGISNADNNANHVYATDGSIADLTQYAKKSEITAGGNVKDIVINGESIVENNVASIAFSTKSNVGVVQVGDGLNVNPFGTISVDTTALTALQKKVAANTAAISGKQDAGRYITYEERGLNDDYCYIIAPYHYIECRTDKFDNGKYNYSHMSSQDISVHNSAGNSTHIDFDGITIDQGGDASNEYHLSLTHGNIASRSNDSSHSLYFQLNNNGVTLEGGRDNRVLTSNGSTIDITQYALKSELPTVPTKVSELQNDSEFIVKSVYDEKIAALEARIAALEAKHPEAAE